MKNTTRYSGWIVIVFASISFSDCLFAADNLEKRNRHKLYVPSNQPVTGQSQTVIPYQDKQVMLPESKKVKQSQNVAQPKDANSKNTLPKVKTNKTQAFRFAIQLGFFKDKSSVWRFMKNKGLAGKDYHTVETRHGYVLLFGRYQTFEMASIVWEQVVFDYRDSFIVNL